MTKLLASVATIEHQEHTAHLDLLSVLRDHAGALSQLYRSLFATTGAVINPNFITGVDVGHNGLLVAPVPEHSTFLMIAIGGVALLGMMHRKKHRTA